MIRKLSCFTVILLALFSIQCSVQPPEQSMLENGELQCGFAKVDITPPLGYRMSGYFRERLNNGVSDPLYAKALVLQQGAERLAFVTCDVVGFSREITNRARQRASEKTEIAVGNILINATHTHTGPLYFGALRDYFHEKAVAEHGEDPHEKVDYPEQLVSAIATAVEEAVGDLEPSRLKSGSAHQEGLSFNRRFRMKDGTVRFNPGVLNPDIVEVVGPIDPQIGIIFIHRQNRDTPAAAIVNFALHLDTVGGTKYGADYPYYLEQSLRGNYGPDFLLLYGTGTCGDINHIDVTSKERLQTEFIGKTLAETVVSSAADLKDSKTALAAKSSVVTVPLQRVEAEKVAWAKEAMTRVGTQEISFLEQVEAYKVMDIDSRDSDTIPLEVQVFRLSPDLAVVGLPGEVFVELGLEIKQSSPFATTLVIELCQDAPGYLPTLKAFSEGSYETVNSRIAPGGAEKMVAKTIEVLRELVVG